MNGLFVEEKQSHYIRNRQILAIDPGNIESGVVLFADGFNCVPVTAEKMLNEELLEMVRNEDYKVLVIEMIASYGMPVGATVFETCVWIGRFLQIAENRGIEVQLIVRKAVVKNICNTNKGKDSNIIQALIDRFAKDTPNKGKGHKSNPGFFYGFKADIWQAFALGVTYYDLATEGGLLHGK